MNGGKHMTYNIIRYYRPDLRKRPRVIARNVSLEYAQSHCQNSKTASKTYFDGYERN